MRTKKRRETFLREEGERERKRVRERERGKHGTA